MNLKTIENNCERFLKVSAWLSLALLVVLGFTLGGYAGGLLIFLDDINLFVENIQKFISNFSIIGKRPTFPTFPNLNFNLLTAFLGAIAGAIIGLQNLLFAYVLLKARKAN